MTNKELFLQTADKIGDRLIKSALWNGDRCTWYVRKSDKKNPHSKKSKREIADCNMYQGTSGIVLFLNELSKYSDNKTKIIETAEGAIRYSIEEGKKLPDNSFGFHSGMVGIAYALVEFALVSGKNEYFKEAEKLLLQLKGNEDKDYGWDVIGGASGAIPALLNINEHLENDLAFSIAENLGNNLIKKAKMEPMGWSWGAGNTNIRNICGLAHGASGAGHAFIELYNYTGLSKYLYIAELAFLYERHFFNKELNNWPDFRFSELSEYIYYKNTDELKTALREGSFPAYQTKYMSAWCHGAPGIGLTRIRVFELTKNKLYKKESLAAIEATKISLQYKLPNYSLCHGIGGNCETLIYGYEIIKNEEYLKIAETIGVEGIKRFERDNMRWPCGTINWIPDPSLLLGEAGIGYYFLRLFDQNVPSVLLLSTKIKNNTVLDEKYSFKEIKKSYVNYYFGNTIRLISQKDKIQDDFFEFGKKNSDVELVFKKLDKCLTPEFNRNQAITDVFNLEKEKYLLTMEINDFTEEYIEKFTRKPFKDINLDESEIRLMPLVKVLLTTFPENKNNDDESYTLLFRKENKIIEKNLNVLSYFILKSIKEPSTLKDILISITENIEIEDNSKLCKLNETITKQIEEFYKARLIEITERKIIKMLNRKVTLINN